MQTIDAGGALGWSWLYPPFQWQFSARAVEPVEAVAFGAASLRKKAEENHDFGYDLLLRVGRVMLETLRGTRRKLVKFYVRDLVECQVRVFEAQGCLALVLRGRVVVPHRRLCRRVM